MLLKMKIQEALFLFVVEYAFALDQRGTEFVFSFIDSRTTGPKDMRVLIITADRPCSVSISLIKSSDVISKFLKEGETWKAMLPPDVQYTRYNYIETMAVSVSASSEVSIYAQNGNETRRAGFLVLPTHMLSTSYVAVTCGEAEEHQDLFPVFLIVAVMDKTDVVVTYKISEDETCENHVPGESEHYSLGAYQVIGIRCSDDFTGTYITSNNPVAVISGHQKSSCKGLRGDFLQEMLIPVDLFGVNYVVPYNIGYPYGTFTRVIAAGSSSVITTQKGGEILLNPFTYHDVPLINCHECIKANAPVSVVSFGKSRLNDKTIKGDAFMYIVPPVNMYSSFVKLDMNLVTEAELTDTFHALIVMKSTEQVSLPGAKVDEIQGCGYKVYSTQVLSWPLAINLTNIKMAAFLYGGYDDLRAAVGIPLNMQIGEVVPEERSTSSEAPQSTSASQEATTSNENSSATTSTTETSPPTLPINTLAPVLPVISTHRRPRIIKTETVQPKTVASAYVTSSAISTSTEAQRNCHCICIKHPVLNMSEEFLLTLRKKFEDLILDKRNLSKTIRKMVCAHDNRISAIGVGHIGVGVIVCAASCILIPDLVLAVKTYFSGKCIRRRISRRHTYKVKFSRNNHE